MKKPTSIRLSPTADRLLETLARRLGVTKAAVMEMAVREMAEHKNIPIPEDEDPNSPRRTEKPYLCPA